MTEGNWAFNSIDSSYSPTNSELFSVFPTIVEPKNKTVYCRRCHRWEYIVKFESNKLMSQCGKVYGAPFVVENSLVNYGYQVHKGKQCYSINVKSQLAKLNDHLLVDNNFVLNLDKKVLYRNGKAVFEKEDLAIPLCKEITQECLDEMGEIYRKEFGIKPTVTSQLKGFKLLLGYTLSPFNINFFTISQHWGLNPYDKDFYFLSSGNSPSAEREMFDCLGIKPTKKIRKLYQKFPQSIVCYAAAHDLGFNDVNILQRSFSAEFYAFLSFYMISFVGGEVSYPIRQGLKCFVTDLLALSQEKTVWNSIEKTVAGFIKKKNDSLYITDALYLYEGIHEFLPDHDKLEVMHEGFNHYTHDFLNRRASELNVSKRIHERDELINFNIEEKFLDLEYKCGKDLQEVWDPAKNDYDYVQVKDEERYCFHVARNPKELTVIGQEMHNCVGYGYKNAVAERRSTIVYAMYRNKYKICIEVSPDFSIRQSLGPCNKPLAGEDLDAYREWCEKKNIKFSKAFSVLAEPGYNFR